METKIEKLIRLFAQPSTIAGLAGLATLAGYMVSPEDIEVIAGTFLVLASVVAIITDSDKIKKTPENKDLIQTLGGSGSQPPKKDGRGG
jgi:hypothetical protein